MNYALALAAFPILRSISVNANRAVLRRAYAPCGHSAGGKQGISVSHLKISKWPTESYRARLLSHRTSLCLCKAKRRAAIPLPHVPVLCFAIAHLRISSPFLCDPMLYYAIAHLCVPSPLLCGSAHNLCSSTHHIAIAGRGNPTHYFAIAHLSLALPLPRDSMQFLCSATRIRSLHSLCYSFHRSASLCNSITTLGDSKHNHCSS